MKFFDVVFGGWCRCMGFNRTHRVRFKNEKVAKTFAKNVNRVAAGLSANGNSYILDTYGGCGSGGAHVGRAKIENVETFD